MTIYVVRHGSAGARDDSDPRDELRPLDPDGESQARRLADWLRHEPIEEIVSSPYRRCIQTVEPLADELGLPIEIDEALTEGASIDRSWSRVAGLARRTALVCSHGDVIPEVIRRAQQRGMHIPGKSGAAKGSVWTLEHWDGERFATGIYTPIPRPDAL